MKQRQNHRLVLVIAGEAEGGEIGEPIDMVDVPLQVTLHLQGAAPFLEGEHGLPVEPEVGFVEVLVEAIADLLVFEFLLRGQEEFEKLFLGLLVQGEVMSGGELMAAVVRRPAEGLVRILFVKPIVFVQDGDFGV